MLIGKHLGDWVNFESSESHSLLLQKWSRPIIASCIAFGMSDFWCLSQTERVICAAMKLDSGQVFYMPWTPAEFCIWQFSMYVCVLLYIGATRSLPLLLQTFWKWKRYTFVRCFATTGIVPPHNLFVCIAAGFSFSNLSRMHMFSLVELAPNKWHHSSLLYEQKLSRFCCSTTRTDIVAERYSWQ